MGRVSNAPPPLSYKSDLYALIKFHRVFVLEFCPFGNY